MKIQKADTDLGTGFFKNFRALEMNSHILHSEVYMNEEKFTVRALKDGDRAGAVAVEAAAMPGHRYLDDAWDLFTKKSKGALSGVFAGSEIIGIGKLTVLYGNFGWLETLRVDPEWQSQGAGKALYRSWAKEAEALGLTQVGMYTGATNVVSRHLAEINGLHMAGAYGEFTRAVRPLTKEECSDFVQVSPAEGEACLSPCYPEMKGGFLCLNQTYYPVGPGLGTCMAENGWLYTDGTTMLVLGARFQPEAGLFLPFLSGDAGKALTFADALAYRSGAALIRSVLSEEQTPYGEGFAATERKTITLWGKLKKEDVL
jgi:GNAT superfamily N-acetyltransferase